MLLFVYVDSREGDGIVGIAALNELNVRRPTKRGRKDEETLRYNVVAHGGFYYQRKRKHM